jgi:hypothetical protein
MVVLGVRMGRIWRERKRFGLARNTAHFVRVLLAIAADAIFAPPPRMDK